MKTLLLSIGLLLTTYGYCIIDTIKVSSTISDVTVFFSGAQINRQATLSLKKGKYLLFFEDLPVEINPNSIQVKGMKNLTILSVKHELKEQDISLKSKEEKRIQKQIEGLKEKKNQLQEKIHVFEIEEGILLDNSKVYRGVEGITVEKIKATADFYRNRLNEIRKGKLDLKAQQGELKSSMEDLFKELNELKAQQKKRYSQLQVAVQCARAPLKPLQFSYYITSAGWVPTYDFRVLDISKPLTLVYRANVFQSSGEDWNKVNVVLSSNNPMLSGSKPSMGSLYLNKGSSYSYASNNSSGSAATIKGRVIDEDNGEPLPFCNVTVYQNNRQILATTTDFNGQYTLKPVPPGSYEVQYSYVGFQTKRINGVTAYAQRITDLDTKMDKGMELQEVEVTSYRKPLFEKDQTTVGTSVTREEINHMAARSVADISRSEGNVVYSRDNSYVRGQRSGGSVTFIDGVKVVGSTFLPQSAIEEVSVSQGGRSAQYGDRSYNAWEDIYSARSYSKSNSSRKDKSSIPSSISLDNDFESRTTHLEYEIPIPYTIPSDGEDYSLQIKEEQLDVEYIYYAVPKLDRDAFLTARINNWNELNLLSGKTSIYYEGTFTGESYLDAQQAEDTISVSLGRDKSIYLSRVGDKTVYDKTRIGKNMKETLGWEITVRNNKQSPITIIVEDQYPLSDRKSIEVELEESSDAKIDTKQGKLSWELSIPPHKKEVINFSYSVEYPKYSNLVVK